MGKLLKQFLQGFFNFFDAGGRFKAYNHFSAPVDEKFGEVPFDVGAFGIFRVFLEQHLVHELSVGAVSESPEGGFALEPDKEGGSLGAVDVDFAELGELDVEVGGAELVYFGVAARSLCAELVAWEVQNAETLRGIFLVEGFKLIVLWRETAPGGRIDNQEHLAFVFGESNRLAVGIGYGHGVKTCL